MHTHSKFTLYILTFHSSKWFWFLLLFFFLVLILEHLDLFCIAWKVDVHSFWIFVTLFCRLGSCKQHPVGFYIFIQFTNLLAWSDYTANAYKFLNDIYSCHVVLCFIFFYISLLCCYCKFLCFFCLVCVFFAFISSALFGKYNLCKEVSFKLFKVIFNLYSASFQSWIKSYICVTIVKGCCLICFYFLWSLPSTSFFI